MPSYNTYQINTILIILNGYLLKTHKNILANHFTFIRSLCEKQNVNYNIRNVIKFFEIKIYLCICMYVTLCIFPLQFNY